MESRGDDIWADVSDEITSGRDPVPGISPCLFSIIIPIPYSITSDNWAELIISLRIPAVTQASAPGVNELSGPGLKSN